MKILHAVSSLNPVGGGPIEVIKQLGRANQQLGHRVEVASLDAPVAEFLKTFPFPVYALGPRMNAYGFSRRFVPWLRENASNYDVVIVNGIWQYNSFGTWRALRHSSTPYVVFTHGMLDPWFKRTYPLKHLKKWLYWPWGEYRVLRDAAAVIFTCEEERVLARQSFWLYSANEKVINYGTAAPGGNQTAQQEEFLNRFPHLRDKRLLLFLGRLHPKKGCDIVLRSFASVLAHDPRWHLVMAGPDQTGWKSSLSSLAMTLHIENRITWAGMVGGDAKWGLIKSSEALFLPSHQENFGIVVAEALACGVPALISDKVNIWREVESAGAGLVAPDTLQGASTLLAKWSALDPAEHANMRTQARKCFEEKFEIGLVSKSLIAILRGLPNPHVAKKVA